MSNELPQGFQDLISKNISKKAHKLVSILFTGKCAKGRIKRMRKGKSSGNTFSRRNKHLNYSHSYWHIALSLINRWNRH